MQERQRRFADPGGVFQCVAAQLTQQLVLQRLSQPRGVTVPGQIHQGRDDLAGRVRSEKYPELAIGDGFEHLGEGAGELARLQGEQL